MKVLYNGGLIIWSFMSLNFVNLINIGEEMTDENLLMIHISI